MLATFVAATILLIALPDDLPWMALPGVVAFVACGVFIWKDPKAEVKRRMGVLLGCIAILAIPHINTSTETANFLQVGIPFSLVLLVPALILARTDPGIIRYRLLPKKIRGIDVFYTVLSIPLAWAVLQFYWLVNPNLHFQWTLPEGEAVPEEIQRLFVGINLVGVWDELFFVNTVFAVLRSLFRFRIANAVQAVVYTSVLFDMAFIGIGPLIVYFFAWTQGSMYEQSENLLWVLVVHLIVDYFLVAAIVQGYYPEYGLGYLWQHKF